MTTNLRIFCFVFLLASAALADQASFSNNGGSVTLGSDVVLTGSALGSPAGSASFSCPVTAGAGTATVKCAGGSFSLLSTDGSTAINGAFTAGELKRTTTGGGKGHPVTYWYAFTAHFAGSLTQGAAQEAVSGTTTQLLAPLPGKLGTGTISSGLTAMNSTYEPVYIADTNNNRIVLTDDMNGSNWTTLGKLGNGTNQFHQPWSIFLDSSGEIYVTDSVNCRVVRMDDMTGTNWTKLGTCGAGTNQFSNPTGLFVDSAGEIFVGDTGNDRIVRMDDMSGTNWTTFGSDGNGTGQFNGLIGVAANSAGQIFIADTGNSRLVRMDDMSGTNWTTFGANGTGVDQFGLLTGVWIDNSGEIYATDAYNNRVVRMDDMSGTNWTVLGGTLGNGTGQFTNPYGAFVDQFGVIFVADTHGNRIVKTNDLSGTDWSNLGKGGGGTGEFSLPSGIYAAPPAGPAPAAKISTNKLAFGDEVVGLTAGPLSATVTNIGSAPLSFNGIAATGDFAESDNCSGPLPAAQRCTASVTFTPTAGGTRKGTLSFSFASAPAGHVSLSGVGTLVSVFPPSLNFGKVAIGGGSASLNVTVSNPGAAAAGISSIAIQGASAYSASNPCPASLAAGTSCMVTVTFTPPSTNAYKGKLVVTDGSGTAQDVTLAGTGVNH